MLWPSRNGRPKDFMSSFFSKFRALRSKLCLVIALESGGERCIVIAGPARARWPRHRATRRWSAGDTLQIRQLIGVSSVIGPEPSGATQCALQLVTSIESHGQAQDVSAEKLREAFFTIVEPRLQAAADLPSADMPSS